MDTSDKILIFLIFAFLIIGGFFLYGRDAARKKACEEKGGTYYTFRDGTICVKSDAVIRI